MSRGALTFWSTQEAAELRDLCLRCLAALEHNP